MICMSRIRFNGSGGELPWSHTALRRYQTRQFVIVLIERPLEAKVTYCMFYYKLRGDFLSAKAADWVKFDADAISQQDIRQLHWTTFMLDATWRQWHCDMEMCLWSGKLCQLPSEVITVSRRGIGQNKEIINNKKVLANIPEPSHSFYRLAV